MSETKTTTTKTTLTTFEDVKTATANSRKDLKLIISDNEVHQYARLQHADKSIKSDYYDIFRDFCLYYNRKNTVKLSISDKYLTAEQCKKYKATHNKVTDKVKALEFSVELAKLDIVITELVTLRYVTMKALEAKKSKATATKTATKTTTATKKSKATKTA